VILRDCRLGELWRVERLCRVLVACGPVWFLLGHAGSLSRLSGGEFEFAICVGGAEVRRVGPGGEVASLEACLDELEAAA